MYTQTGAVLVYYWFHMPPLLLPDCHSDLWLCRAPDGISAGR